MQIDFHYYATYAAAVLAGYSHEEAVDIAWSSQFVDCCSRSFLKTVDAPLSAATTQLQLELMDTRTDLIGLQDITRIWASFHFLPYDLYAEVPRTSKAYRMKFRLLCDTNSDLLLETVELARGGSLQAAGIAMHVLADTWAHRYFAGTPSLVINNTDFQFDELLREGDTETERRIRFNHNPASPDDLENALYTNSLYQGSENSIMNLGHGRAGHLPDYGFLRYRYLPAWNGYKEVVKDNPSDYLHAFCQMIYALKYIRGEESTFEKGTYAFQAIEGLEEEIKEIIAQRRPLASEGWKALGEKLSGREIPDFETHACRDEYAAAEEQEKDGTFLGRFILAALAQKSMVTNRIFISGNLLAGFSADYRKEGFRGIKDFIKLVEAKKEKRP